MCLGAKSSCLSAWHSLWLGTHSTSSFEDRTLVSECNSGIWFHYYYCYYYFFRKLFLIDRDSVIFFSSCMLRTAEALPLATVICREVIGRAFTALSFGTSFESFSLFCCEARICLIVCWDGREGGKLCWNQSRYLMEKFGSIVIF